MTIAKYRYDVLKYDTHYIALRYHWDKNTIYDMTLSARKDYIEILTLYDEAEKEAMEKATNSY